MNTQPDHTLPPWCLRLVSELTAADDRATAVAKALTPQQLNWKPRPEQWGVGQCLEHLFIANEVYLRALANSLAGRSRGVAQDIAPGWFGGWFIRRYIDPASGTSRARAPRKMTPAAHVDASILDRFLNSNHEVLEFVYRARNYDVNRIRFKNPFIPILRFTVGTGLEILATHQRRHLLQAERIRQSPEFPQPGDSDVETASKNAPALAANTE